MRTALQEVLVISILQTHHIHVTHVPPSLASVHVEYQNSGLLLDIIHNFYGSLLQTIIMSLAAARPLISVYSDKAEAGGVTVCLPAVFRSLFASNYMTC